MYIGFILQCKMPKVQNNCQIVVLIVFNGVGVLYYTSAYTVTFLP